MTRIKRNPNFGQKKIEILYKQFLPFKNHFQHNALQETVPGFYSVTILRKTNISFAYSRFYKIPNLRFILITLCMNTENQLSVYLFCK